MADMTSIERKLQIAYNLAKKRSVELSALELDAPEKHRHKLQIASKAHLAIATIIYTSLSTNILPELESYVASASTSLPKKLFDPNEWSRYLDSAANIRQQAYVKGAKLICPEHLDDLSAVQTDLQHIKDACQEDLEQLRTVMETMKAHAINALTTFQLQNTKLENEFLEKEIAYRNEIQHLRDSIQSLSKNRKNSSIENFTSDFESKYIVLLQSSAEKERQLEQQIDELNRINDDLRSKLRSNSLFSPHEEIAKLKQTFADDQQWTQERIKELTKEIEDLKIKETKSKSPLASRFDQAKLQESYAEAILKIRHVQEIFCELEHFLRSETPAPTSPSLNDRSNRISLTTKNNESEVVWEVEEFYRRGVLIQDLFQARIVSEVTSKSKSAADIEASESELQIMKRKLEELQQQYHMLEDQYEKTEVESFEVSKQLAHKNYLYSQQMLLQQSASNSQIVETENEPETVDQ